MDSDLLLDLDSCHVLRGDQDVLPVIRGLCAVNHHTHADTSVNRIHEDVELVQTSQRLSY